MTIEGVPARFQSGLRHTLVITVRPPELRAAGFELSARYAGGPAANDNDSPMGDYIYARSYPGRAAEK